MPFEEGPYVQAAAFCAEVIEDKTGALTLVRMIDTVTHTVMGPDPPAEMPPVPFQAKLVIALKSGKVEGGHQVRVVPVLPSGETESAMERTVHLAGDERGTNLVVNTSMTFKMEGLHWFNVYFDDELLTRIPFRVRYARVTTGPKQPPGEPQ